MIDYNGEGEWSGEAIQSRYLRYCQSLHIEPLDLSPMEHSNGETRWVYPVMDEVIKGIEEGDAACKQIGIEFIEEDQLFAFGKILKSNTARALRRASLTDVDMERIRKRVVRMLLDGHVPHEYKEYAKLLKKIGLGDYGKEIEEQADQSNSFVMRYVKYLLDPSLGPKKTSMS